MHVLATKAHSGTLAIKVMASLYKRPRSPFWWCKFIDPISGAVRRVSTGFRFDVLDTRKAMAYRAEREADELRRSVVDDESRWHRWVVPFLKQKHAASPKTLARYLAIWRVVGSYLDQQKLSCPAELRREHGIGFLVWRKAAGNLLAKRRRRAVAHNTALLDLKLLGALAQEAVRRDWIKANPLARLGVAREVPKQKAEMTDADIAIIRAEIARKLAAPQNDGERANAEFLRVSFEIAIHQGCRMFETFLDLRDVDLVNHEITFLAKGRKRYIAPLCPALVPLFQELKDRGQSFTYTQPRMPSLVWWKFIDRLRRKHPRLARVSFHSTRVSVVSRLGRGGVPQRVAMAVVNHASTTIHHVYRRVHVSEVPAVWQALKEIGAACPGKPEKDESPDAPPSSP